ncbi:thiamine diphosphokinase [Butyrivibrio sp. NC3005]|uniref:thiamine diphosphokinase n=1 Tax=Butyrivibrio sp. NC3005 TaxID=1280685 RepID=UPI00040444B8|nr:thiamine diphosphokinase [Butyrivibrio sp. NC3005]
MEKGTCIIVSAGDFSEFGINKKQGDLLIACDAGLKHVLKLYSFPDLIIGDFDSLGENEEDLRLLSSFYNDDPDSVIKLNVRKDDTDTLTAIKKGFEKGYTDFKIFGALGGDRLDHTLANLQSLLYIKRHGGNGKIIDSNKMLTVVENEIITLNKGLTGRVSVFAMGQKAKGVYLKGLSYEMENGTITEDFPIGVSNEFVPDKEAEIGVADGTLLVYIERL